MSYKFLRIILLFCKIQRLNLFNRYVSLLFYNNQTHNIMRYIFLSYILKIYTFLCFMYYHYISKIPEKLFF